MARDSAIPPESFEEILAWLHPDREVAGLMYVQLRHDLTKLFRWRRCADPEGLTDAVFDRVERKVQKVKPTFEGDPRLYFRAVANNLIKENFNPKRVQVSLEEVELPEPRTIEGAEITEDMEECLQLCLQKLSPRNRELIMAYYAKEKQAKIDHRSELADRLGIHVKTLRVRVYRIRSVLEECIGHCLNRKAQER